MIPCLKLLTDNFTAFLLALSSNFEFESCQNGLNIGKNACYKRVLGLNFASIISIPALSSCLNQFSLIYIVFSLLNSPNIHRHSYTQASLSCPHTEPHCKKELAIFPSPAGMSLIKLSLGGKKLNYSRPGRV